jgi:hypothetical protein
MIKTVRINTEIPPDRNVLIVFPDDVPVGPAELTVVVSPSEKPKVTTLGDLLGSEFFGMWRDRPDISDNLEFARKLRATAWKRTH